MNFKCLSCDKSLKTKRVEKHLLKKCIDAKVVCLGCGKKLRGEKWKKHSKCLIEPVAKVTTEHPKKTVEPVKPSVPASDKQQKAWKQLLLKTLDQIEADNKKKDLLRNIFVTAKLPQKRESIEVFLNQSVPRVLRSLARKIFSEADEAKALNSKKEVSREATTEKQKSVPEWKSNKNAKRRQKKKLKHGGLGRPAHLLKNPLVRTFKEHGFKNKIEETSE